MPSRAPSPSRLLALTLLLALAAPAGCSDDPDVIDPCDALRATCAVDQKACVVDNGEATCAACPAGEFANPAGDCEALKGSPITHTFPDNTTAAGAEILGMCRSWTLNNDEPIYVNALELQQSEASHHSNWTFVPDDRYDGPDGVWPCGDRNYSQLEAAIAGGVLYAQSTQASKEVQKFPNGAAVKLPAHARIISDIHTLNTTASEVSGNMKVSLYTLPLADVSVVLTPFHVTYDALNIPPQSHTRVSGECELESWYQQLTGQPLDLKIYYVLPHTHALGSRMFLEAVGGPMDGTSIIDVEGFNGEARGRAYDPPLDLKGSTGLRFGCEFKNPRSEPVQWGFGDQEMCEALGFAASPIAFESRVSENMAGPDDGAIKTFSGGCDSIAFEWSP